MHQLRIAILALSLAATGCSASDQSSINQMDVTAASECEKFSTLNEHPETSVQAVQFLPASELSGVPSVCEVTATVSRSDVPLRL